MSSSSLSSSSAQPQEIFKVLEYGNVTLRFAKPCKSLEFNHGEGKPAIVVPSKSFFRLFDALDEVVPSAQLMTEMCAEVAAGTREPLKDEIFFSRTIDTYSKSNQLRVEASVYRNKTYIFLKRFYLDKEFQVWKAGKGCLTLSLGEDLSEVKELLLFSERRRFTKEEDKGGDASPVEGVVAAAEVAAAADGAAAEVAAATEMAAASPSLLQAEENLV